MAQRDIPHFSKKMYDFLADLAAEGTEPITYGHLAVVMSHIVRHHIPRWRMSGALERVSTLCMVRQEPNLTAFVVRKETGYPASGYNGKDPEVERKSAYDFHFPRVYPHLAAGR